MLFFEELALNCVAPVGDEDALGAWLPTMGEGLPAELPDPLPAELPDPEFVGGNGVAVPEPPVIEKNVEKITEEALDLGVKRMAY